MPTLIFVINVDWFFVSHFLHLARAAKQEGWHVIVATHCEVEDASDKIRAAGATLVALPAHRGPGGARALPASAAKLARVIAAHPGAVVHGFGQFGVLVTTMAAARAHVRRRVFTVTGRGYAAARASLGTTLTGLASRSFYRLLADSRDSRWIVENEDDVAASGLLRAHAAGRVTHVIGAGVDISRFAVTAMPPQPPLRVALVSRMIWSKGVDLAVAAVDIARRTGRDITLSLVGDIDPANPASMTAEELHRLAQSAGVSWLGRVSDIASVWAAHHLAVLPSRGGEGVPKSLIEAAACGRPVLTTDVPGCAAFAAATHGWVVAANSAPALAQTLCNICDLKDLTSQGRAARHYVEQVASEAVIWQATQQLYGDAVTPAGPPLPRATQPDANASQDGSDT